MDATTARQVEVIGGWHAAHEKIASLEPPPAGHFWAVTTRQGDDSPKIIYLAKIEY